MDLRDLKTTEAILKGLEEFESNDQSRILRWVIEKLDLQGNVKLPGLSQHGAGVPAGGNGSGFCSENVLDAFEHVAMLFAAAEPQTDSQRALVVAAYLQHHENHEDLTGQQVNAVLKDLGHQCKNITDAITTLKNKKPSLMVQTGKTGSTKQARKRYKVTHPGFALVNKMIDGASNDEE